MTHNDAVDLTSRIGTVSGFGWVNLAAGSGSNELRFINVPIVSDAACQAAVTGSFNNTIVCTSTTGNVGTW